MKKIFTGDRGDTAFAGGRVAKSDSRVAAYGDIDELSSFIGLARSRLIDKAADAWLREVQKDLFVIGAELAAAPGAKVPTLSSARNEAVEAEVHRLEAVLPELRNFILPAGAPSAALLHVARCVARRAERNVIAAHPSKEHVVKYLNRLNYLLFLLARRENAATGIDEELWKV